MGRVRHDWATELNCIDKRLKTPGVNEGNPPCFCEINTQELSHILRVNTGQKSTYAFKRREEINNSEIYQSILLLVGLSSKEIVEWTLDDWGFIKVYLTWEKKKTQFHLPQVFHLEKGEYPTLDHSYPLAHLRGRKTKKYLWNPQPNYTGSLKD